MAATHPKQSLDGAARIGSYSARKAVRDRDAHDPVLRAHTLSQPKQIDAPTIDSHHVDRLMPRLLHDLHQRRIRLHRTRDITGAQ
jgi:hypothetical protein